MSLPERADRFKKALGTRLLGREEREGEEFGKEC